MTDGGQFAGRTRAWRVSILAIAGFAIGVSGHAQAPAPYYDGKTITVYVGRTPGSGADLAARVFARFWSGHIPGEPTIVVRNLPGGGGTRVWNYGAEVASADGLHVLFSPTNGAVAVLNEPGLRADFSTMPFVGGLLSPNMAYVRTDKVERPEGLAIPLWHNPSADTEGNVTPLEVAADIPSCTDFYRQVIGTEPSGEFYELYKWILPRVNNIVYAALLPPGTPEAQVNVLRDSFVQVTRDPGYRAEEQTMYGFSLPLIGAEEGTEILRSLYDVPEDVAAFLAAYVDEVR